MKKRLCLLWAMVAIFAGNVFSQQKMMPVSGNGIVKTETRDVEKFEFLDVKAVDVFLKQGESAEIKIEAEDNILEHISTEVVNDTLKIRLLSDVGFERIKPIKVFLVSPSVKGIRATAGSSVTVEGTLSGERLVCYFTAGSNFDGGLSFTEYSADLKAGSIFNVTGKVDSFNLNISGGAKFNGKDLIATNAQARVSGGSKASITAEGKSSIASIGGSKVTFYGDRGMVSLSESDVSNIKVKKIK